MRPFAFSTAGTIRFGRGVAQDAAAVAAGFSTSVLVLHGRTPARAGWLLDDLRRRGAEVLAIACPGEPDLTLVEDALAAARPAAPGVVVAVGGGAAIDLGKALAALIPNPAGPLAYLEVVGEGRALDVAPLPVIAVPTTAGTGSEVTKNAVIGVPAHRRKVSLRDPRMIPRIALVDPALTDRTPAAVTFASGLDAVTQVIEPYVSTVANPLTDALCRDAIPRGLAALVRLSAAEDPAARDDIALASLCGGIALANAGLGAVHGLAAVIGGRTRAAHGAICAALLPHVLTANAAAVPPDSAAAARLQDVRAWIAAALSVPPAGALETLASWSRHVGIPRIADMAIDEADIPAIGSEARSASSSRANPVPPQAFDFESVLRSSLTK
jgi:alcohol dehydrogenase class IV